MTAEERRKKHQLELKEQLHEEAKVCKTTCLLHFDEGLTLKMSAFESLYGVQFTLSTQLIKPKYLTPLLHFVRDFANLLSTSAYM